MLAQTFTGRWLWGQEVFSRCKFGWNGIILSSEKFLKERKGTKGKGGEERLGKEEGKGGEGAQGKGVEDRWGKGEGRGGEAGEGGEKRFSNCSFTNKPEMLMGGILLEPWSGQ